MTLSNDHIWRRTQLRFIGFGAFFILSIGALLFKKAAARFGTLVPAVLLTSVLVVPAAVLHFRRRRSEQGGSGDRELEASACDIESQLRCGALAPGDLVREGQHWTTLLDSVRFGDVAAEINAAARRGARLRMAAAISLGVAAALALFATLANFETSARWLLND